MKLLFPKSKFGTLTASNKATSRSKFLKNINKICRAEIESNLLKVNNFSKQVLNSLSKTINPTYGLDYIWL
jgi:flagellar motor switch protein FliG